MLTSNWNSMMQAEDLPGHLTEDSLIAVIRTAVQAALEQEDSPWLDVNGCARYLNCGTKLVHARSGPNAQGPGALPVHRLGPNGGKRFHKDDLDAWLRKS